MNKCWWWIWSFSGRAFISVSEIGPSSVWSLILRLSLKCLQLLVLLLV